MRDQDGGAHFDETLKDRNYIYAITKGVAFFVQQENGSKAPVPNLLHTSIRQIAEEVLATLRAAKYRADKVLSQAP